jgi:phenylalanyl-tRNA synthetase alpha chain
MGGLRAAHCFCFGGGLIMYTVPKLEDFSPAALDSAAADLLAALTAEAQLIADAKAFEEFRNRWMARKNGLLTQVNDLWLKAAPGAAKREVGQRVNALKQRAEALVAEAEQAAAGSALSSRLAAERVDISLPGIERPLGVRHPVLRTLDELISVFVKMGYSIAEGPEVESDYYNFEALNFPPNHPARDTQDTLFVANQEQRPQRDRLLLRTHTSPVQIRSMERMQPPVRVICPGKVHRNDAPDATHSPVFHQLEGLCVDTNITFGDLKGTLDHAMKSLFGSEVKTSFRPSFFPFTEPSVEVSISCPFCGGKGCRPCKQSGWIELLGAGMVDPNVFGFVNYDAKKLSGFAFGMGVERLAMMTYNVDDIQQFFYGDMRFLEQFA